MSFEVATASNFQDFFERLEAFLTSKGHAFGKRFTGVGTGSLTNYSGKAGSVAQTITLTATSATSFSVAGSVSGSLGTATVGTPFTSSQIDFTITAGGTAYVASDQWVINVSPAWTLSRQFNGVWTGDSSNCGLVNVNSPSTVIASIKAIRPIEIREVGVLISASTSYSPTAFSVEWSDDGSTWTLAQSFSGLVSAGWSLSNERRFTVTASGAHRWWRYRATAFNSSTYRHSYVGFYDTIGASYRWGIDTPWMVVRSPGNDGLLQSVFHTILLVDQPGSDAYGFWIIPHTSYNPLLMPLTQPGYAGIPTAVPLSNLPMPYWFVANGRRFAAGVKISTVYFGMYFGLMLPYARPSVYPLPWFIGGSTSSASTRWSDTGDTTHVFPRAIQGNNHAAVRDIAGIWRDTPTQANLTVASSPGRLYPNVVNGNVGGIRWIRENFGGGYPLLPIIPVVTGVGSMGELDGAFWTTGFGQAAENVITLNRFDHIVLQNAYRVTQGDYWALRLD